MLMEKTRLKSRLIYNLNRDDLRSFVSAPSDNFLINFFSETE